MLLICKNGVASLVVDLINLLFGLSLIEGSFELVEPLNLRAVQVRIPVRTGPFFMYIEVQTIEDEMVKGQGVGHYAQML